MPKPITFFDSTLRATETALRSDPDAHDWAEAEKDWRTEYKIGNEVKLERQQFFAAGTPAWPVERVLQELDIPLQTLFDRAKELGKAPIDRSQFERDQQMMLGIAAVTTAFMRCTSHSSIPKNWPRDKRQDFLGYWGGSCLAKTVTFLSELNRCMVFAFREIYDRDSEGRSTGIKPEIDEWGHPWLMLAFREGVVQLRSCVFSRLKEENLEDVLGRWMDHLEDEVIAWRSRVDESSAKYALLVQSDAEVHLNGPPSHSPDFTSVDWYGTRYTFAKGNQARTVMVLWEVWKSGGHSLTQETIGERIDSSANRFELSKVFRRRKSVGRGYDPHPAWGTMIQQDGKGSYRLVSPESA